MDRYCAQSRDLLNTFEFRHAAESKAENRPNENKNPANGKLSKLQLSPLRGSPQHAVKPCPK